MKILSLFDGMSCGMIAMLNAGVKVDRYAAYEIDKYAVKTSQHNFPMVEQMGDVFKADFTQYQGFDFLVGGSPCTYWSIAQKNNRETEASGLGWELFSQYVRALRESKPKYFIYENNKSMAKAIRDSIRETFGFEEICINSALVSAQNRQRFYWVGKYNPDTDWYDKVNVEQPEDRGILLRDVLDGMVRLPDYCGEKSRPVDAHYCHLESETWFNRVYNPNPAKQQHDYVAEPVNPCEDGKSHTLTASYYKIAENPFSKFGNEKARQRVAEPDRLGIMPASNGIQKDSQGNRIYSIDGKSVTQSAQGGGWGAKTGLHTVPLAACVAQRGRYASGNRSVKVDGGTEQFYEARDDGKTSTLTTVQKDNMVAEPCCMRYERTEEAKACRKDYEAGLVHHGFHELSELHPRIDGKTNTLSTVLKDNPICEPVASDEKVGVYPNEKGELTECQSKRIYSVDAKGRCLQAGLGGVGVQTGLYTVPVDTDIVPFVENKLDDAVEKYGHIPEMWNPYNNAEITDKAPTQTAQCASQTKSSTVMIIQYATPCEWDENGIPTKAVSGADGKTYTVYCVSDGQITIKGKTYPIKLVDGYYIIRKLTVSECKRLQTVPEWYDFSCVSNTQAYKMLGNGWTCEVITHLINACLKPNDNWLWDLLNS